jgi:anti-anti-sigma factor
VAPSDGFAVTVEVVDGRAEFRVRGDLDHATAPELAAITGALLDHRHRPVVFDMAEVEFLGAAGLGVIARAVFRLGSAEGGVTVRGPSPATQRLLAIAGMAGLVHVEPGLGRVGPARGVASEREGEVNALARRSALAADRDVVDAALRLVVALAHATVDGADGVSVSLTRHGRLVSVAATDDTVAGMDRDQHASGEGPCVAAAEEGRWFHVESLQDESRWPTFVPLAQARGINSILSTPLRASTGPAGALNIYSFTAHAFAERAQHLAEQFAGRASDILADAGFGVADEEDASERRAHRLQDALLARETIAQAQGVLMAVDGVSADEAYDALRRSSCATGQPLRSRAADVLASAERDGSPRRAGVPAERPADA